MTQDANEELSVKTNMLWNSFGSLSYLGCQWLMTVLVVRLSSGFEAAGSLSLAMSVYNMFSSVALYRMYTYQVSDVRHENTVGEYFGLRIITCLIALVMIAVYSFMTCPLNSIDAILSFSLYKIASLLIDVLHGLDQQHHRMDYIGKSLAIQGAVSLMAFCSFLPLTNDLTSTFLCMTVGIVVIGILYDRPRAAQFEALKVGISRKKTAYLLKSCFPIVVAGIACGAYFSEAYASKDIHQLTVLLLKASAAIALVGILSAIALLIMGEPLLTLMYGTQVAPYMYLMTPIIICTAVTAYVWFLNDLLVALRHFRGSFIGNTCAFALTIPAAFWFIPLFGMNGVSFA